MSAAAWPSLLVGKPTPAVVRAVRQRAGLTQAQAAQLVSDAQGQPYRTWQGYEAEEGKLGHRAMPLATWALFLLLTDQHPTHTLTARKSA